MTDLMIQQTAVGDVPATLPPALGALVAALAAPLGGSVQLKDAATGRIVWASGGHAALFGRSTAQLLGSDDTGWLDDSQRSLLRQAEQAAQAGDSPAPITCRIDRDGRKRDYRVAVVATGSPPMLLSLWIDDTAAREREQQLVLALAQIEAYQSAVEAARRDTPEQPLRDDVTGLYLRAQFDDLLRREVDLSLREHREFALAAIELDPFNEAVRGLGTPAEQRVLEALGRLLRGNTRAMDASCRLDSRRFAVLLSGVGLATAHSRMEGMRRQCATQIVVQDGRNLGFTVSMGVASFPHTAHNQDDLVHAAEAALAEARRRGGNLVTLASIRFEGG